MRHDSDDSKYACEEYLDALVTIELAVAVARREGRPVNTAIRACWTKLRQRITNGLNRDIFDGLAKQMLPHGALCMLRRRLDEA